MLLNICLILGLIAWLAYLLGDLYLKHRSGAPAQESPRIVVNVPADFKPLEALPPTQIEGARAVLFYTIYSKAIEGFTSDGQLSLSESEEAEAYNSASRAVEAVFGEVAK